jgi:hypothetical protein
MLAKNSCLGFSTFLIVCIPIVPITAAAAKLASAEKHINRFY